MAMFLFWECSKCGYRVTTSGPHEFYRDDTGQRQPYGHPSPRSEDAIRHGVQGFSVNHYCPACREIRDVVTHEFAQPSSPLGGWFQMGMQAHKPSTPSCDKCGAELKDMLDPSNICPKCNEGNFEPAGGGIS